MTEDVDNGMNALEAFGVGVVVAICFALAIGWIPYLT